VTHLLCEPVRHGRVRLLSEDGAHFGQSAKGGLSGFRSMLSFISPPAQCSPQRCFQAIGMVVGLSRPWLYPQKGASHRRGRPPRRPGVQREGNLRLAVRPGPDASGDAVRRRERGTLRHQSGSSAHRKQLLRAMAPVRRPGMLASMDRCRRQTCW